MVIRSKYLRFILFFSAVIVAVYCYLDGLNGTLLFDDFHVIKDNNLIKIHSLNPATLVQAMESFAAGGRQISMLTFALNHYAFGESTWWLKAINLVIHCLNGILIFLLANILVKINPRSNSTQLTEQSLYVIPAFACALWLVTPINLTSVLYISQRMTLLSSFFILTGILCYIWARLSIAQTPRKLLYLPLIIGGFTAAAYVCKENGALLPLFIFAIELFCFRFCTAEKKDLTIISIFSIGVLVVLVAVFYKFYQSPTWIIDGYRNRSFTLSERVMTQFRALVFYIYQIVLPSNNLLGLWHDDFPISAGILKPVSTLLSGITLLGLLLLTFVAYTRAPLIGLGILWFFISHSIESTIIPLEIMHEHRNYLASFGIFFALSFAMANIKIRAFRHVSVALCIGLFLWHTMSLAERSTIWSSRTTLFEHEAKAHPNSPIAAYSLGIEHMRNFLRGNQAAGENARQQFLKVSKMEPEKLNAELALIVGSENGAFDYNPLWLDRAIELFPTAKKHPSLHAAILAFLFCLENDICVKSKHRAQVFFDALAESKNYQYVTLYGVFYANVIKDFAKADKGFESSLRKHDAKSWTNYLFFLIKEKKIQKACDVYSKFSEKLKNHDFKNSANVLHIIRAMEERLRDCSNNS